jgi:hypothetical protein
MARPRKIYPIGARVRQVGEQSPTAQHMGTAVITGHDWHGDHLEYLIRRDKPYISGDSRSVSTLDSTWAFYHTYLADNQPDEIQAALDGLPVPGPNEQP